MSVLDSDLIIERRLAAGMSPIDLAKALHVSATAIRSLETGANHEKLTLHFLQRLANTLGIPIRDLFAADTNRDADQPTSDELKAEAALGLIDKKIDPQDFATALEIPLARAHTAFKALALRRADSAIRIHYRGGKYGQTTVRTILTTEEIRRLEQACTKRVRIAIYDATLLKRTVDCGVAGWDGDVTEAYRPVLARLLRLGWIEHRDGRFFPTADVALSLGIPGQQPATKRHAPPRRFATDAAQPVSTAKSRTTAASPER